MNAVDIISIVIKLLGGIALFLFGMSLLTSSLEKLSTGKIERILEKLSSNILKSILFGAIVTGAIQSSAATIIIVIGLVNAGILKSKSAIGIVIGANIGTTVTGQILRLNDINASYTSALSLLTPSILAPVIIIIGIIMVMACKKEKHKNIGNVLLGLGILFTGMTSMESSLTPVSESPEFANIFTALSNPFIGVLGGTIVTAILQSSSASIGILQAIASTGVINYSVAIPIIVGQNIGACVTPMMSSFKANKNAKRIAFIHLYFNIIGSIIFLGGIYIIKATIGLPFWNSAMGMGAIADFHTLFNVIPAVVFIPFYKVLEKLAYITIKEDKIATLPADDLNILDDRFLNIPGIAVEQINKISVKMSDLAYENFIDTKSLFFKYDDKTVEKIKDRENRIDRIDDVLNNYIVKLKDNLTEEETRIVTSIIHLSTEFERISDHCTNIQESAEALHEKDLSFSKSTMASFSLMLDAVEEILTMSISAFVNNDYDIAKKIEPLEEVIDMLEYKIRDTYIPKLDKETYSVECGVHYLEALSNMERISDHCSNIALYVLRQRDKEKYKFMNPHEYIYNVHNEKTQDYINTTNYYISKYIEV